MKWKPNLPTLQPTSYRTALPKMEGLFFSQCLAPFVATQRSTCKEGTSKIIIEWTFVIIIIGACWRLRRWRQGSFRIALNIACFWTAIKKFLQFFRGHNALKSVTVKVGSTVEFASLCGIKRTFVVPIVKAVICHGWVHTRNWTRFVITWWDTWYRRGRWLEGRATWVFATRWWRRRFFGIDKAKVEHEIEVMSLGLT